MYKERAVTWWVTYVGLVEGGGAKLSRILSARYLKAVRLVGEI